MLLLNTTTSIKVQTLLPSHMEMNMLLFGAAGRGDVSLAMRLIQGGADVHARDYNSSTPLHVAAAKNLRDMVIQLIEMKADINSEDSNNRTPLDVAIAKQSCSAAAALRSLGARSQTFSRTKSGSAQRSCNAKVAILEHFPLPVAKAMMQGYQMDPLCKQETSIFFSNIVDYSSLRGSMDPVALCCMLERLFIKFDKLATMHGVQRVDAIDGCYIAAANFSADQTCDHAVRLARFALHTIAAAAATPIDEQQPALGPVRLLAGMHCGAVCGSFVGAHGGRKYTLLGDAVNVASRMQSHGTEGAVQCSAACAAHIESQGGSGAGLLLAQRDGGVVLKGRGHMDAFWLSAVGDASNACPPGPTAGSPFSATAHALCEDEY